MSDDILTPEWVEHPKYKDYYFSRCGKVASTKKGKFVVLRGGVAGKYEYKNVWVGNKTRIYIHRAVCEIFNGPPMPGQECRHLDGNNKNNNAENLKWGTPSENAHDKIAHGTVGCGEKNPMAKLTKDQVIEIRNRVANGETQKSLCKIFNVSPMTISRAVRKETWK